MDTIWNCAFGLDIDLQKDRNNEYLKKSEALISTSQTISAAAIFSRRRIYFCNLAKLK